MTGRAMPSGFFNEYGFPPPLFRGLPLWSFGSDARQCRIYYQAARAELHSARAALAAGNYADACRHLVAAHRDRETARKWRPDAVV